MALNPKFIVLGVVAIIAIFVLATLSSTIAYDDNVEYPDDGTTPQNAVNYVGLRFDAIWSDAGVTIDDIKNYQAASPTPSMMFFPGHGNIKMDVVLSYWDPETGNPAEPRLTQIDSFSWQRSDVQTGTYNFDDVVAVSEDGMYRFSVKSFYSLNEQWVPLDGPFSSGDLDFFTIHDGEYHHGSGWLW